MDILSDVLNSLRIETFALASLQMHEPWSIDYLRGDAVLFHYVASGHCWLRLDNGHTRQIQAGEAILLPSWKHMFLESPLGAPVSTSITQLVLERGQSLWTPGFRSFRPIRIRNEEDGHECELFSGLFEFDKRQSSFLLEQLPELIILDTHAAEMGSWLAQTLKFLMQEGQRNTPGYEAIATRITDLILIQLFRLYIHLYKDQLPGWIAGLSDPYIRKALVEIHRHPTHDWTVASLGKKAGLSRTAFAKRFASKTGKTPADYVTRWRMHLAATRLLHTDLYIAKIAESVGYNTVFAFSRAFKRQYGVSPGSFRKNPDGLPLGFGFIDNAEQDF